MRTSTSLLVEVLKTESSFKTTDHLGKLYTRDYDILLQVYQGLGYITPGIPWTRIYYSRYTRDYDILI